MTFRSSEVLDAGHIFEGPDGQGFKLKRSLRHGDPIMADLFEPFGGAPAPVGGEAMPFWLQQSLKSLANQ